ncbi:hypothetical protein, partial [Paraburkholderia sp. BCC1884]|uniref:hypothetical protein n=1 Tax=Paraburkholderia sp. BCC1884 TaxID=2562668 RepID=UPI001C91A5C7
MVIVSVAAIAASGTGRSAPVKLMPPESGHLDMARSGHYNLASTCYVEAILKCRSGSKVEVSLSENELSFRCGFEHWVLGAGRCSAN